MNILQIVLASASVGAVISSGFTLLGQYFEREHRRKEVIFNAALKAAKERVDTVIEVVKISGKKATLPDSIILSQTYHRWLSVFFDTGLLPSEAIESEKASRKQLEQAKEDIAQRKVNWLIGNPYAAAWLLQQPDTGEFTPEQIEQIRNAAKQIE